MSQLAISSAGALDASGLVAILRNAADKPSTIQKMKMACVKLNASNVSMPTAKLATEAPSAANNQPSRASFPVRDAPNSFTQALTINQAQAARPTNPTSSTLFSHWLSRI